MIRAGVGFVRLIDRDFVELSNLQRQSLFDEEDIRSNVPKAVAAEAKLRRVNSSVQIDVNVDDVNPTNIEDYIADIDLVLDGLDNSVFLDTSNFTQKEENFAFRVGLVSKHMVDEGCSGVTVTTNGNTQRVTHG